MTREMVTRAFGWKSLATAGILLLTILAGALAARQRGADGPRAVRGVTTTVSQSGLAQGAWLRTLRDERGGPVVEVQLDAVLAEIGRGVVLDRPALLALVQTVVGADPQIEDRPIADVFGKVTRVRVSAQGLSVVLGRRALVQALQHVIGRDDGVEEMTIGEALDAVAGARLTLDGLAGLFDEDAAAALLGSALPAAQRGVSRDPQFQRRQVLRRRYAEVVDLVRQLQRVAPARLNRRERVSQRVSRAADRNALYAAAHERLLAAGRLSAVPLLDGHLRLEDELAVARVGTSSRAERIASRWEARRKAFGDDMANLLFSRDEAMERYEVDRLGLEADTSLSAEEKAQRLRERREALKVELAAQGTFVSFPDEAAAGVPETAGEGRPQ